ncbi:MAG: phage tail assembly chaperone [Robiginitomaculum sp.]|nr:phage tail assembly chaperone [Robiginitomaculum sp.]
MNNEQWGELLRIAMVRFAISPASFWNLSLWEWQQLNSSKASQHTCRKGMNQLCEQFPDN